MKKLLLSIVLIIIYSCSETIVNFQDEKDYIEVKKEITYYKGTPFTGIINKLYNKTGDEEFNFKTIYKEGKIIGLSESTSQNGQLVIKATSELQQNQNIINKNGVIHYKGIPFTGILILEKQKSVGDWDGLAYTYDGKKVKMNDYNFKTTYNNGIREGFHGEYYIKSGVLSVKTTFINGLLDGELVKYYRQDELLGRETFKNGIKEGLQETYYRRDTNSEKPNVLKSRYYLKDGKMHGLSESFHKNGKLEFKGNYNKGEFDGVHETYFRNGELWYKDLYKNGKLIKKNF